MLFVEQFTLFADDFSGQKLKILFYLFACFSQQKLSFFNLLPHRIAGGLQ